MWQAPVDQTTVPNEKTLAKNAENEIDKNDDQQNLKPTPNIDAEISPENTDENEITSPEDVVKAPKENLPTNTRGEKYIFRPNPNLFILRLILKTEH